MPERFIIETERLGLRQLSVQDWDGLCRMLQDKETMYAYEHAFSDEEVQEWLNRQLRRYEKYHFGLWAVVLKHSHRMIGQCGITVQPVHGLDVLEVGYLFEKAFWHQGYATEAACACRDYGFLRLSASEMYSLVRETNQASGWVAKRMGMSLCGRQIKHYYGMDIPHFVYRVTRDEWNHAQNGDEL